MNMPGQASAIASTFEGHKMALDGRAAQALATAAIGAFTGGFIASIVVVFMAPALAEFSTQFGPAEFFALALFAFVATSSVVTDNPVKGLASLFIGLGIAVIGVDGISGAPRFTLDSPNLFDGVSLVTVTVAILALGEVIYVACLDRHISGGRLIRPKGRPWLSGREFREALPAWLRGTAIGMPFGVVPAGGSEIPTFLAFGLEKRLDAPRKPPATRRPAWRWARCSPSACRSRRPRRSCSPPSASTGCSPARCSSSAPPSSCGRCSPASSSR
jgi:putative tricarboxylic transport membrane protein